MTHPYTDMKEAAEKVIADQLAYISGKKLKDEMAWHDALSKYRQLADPRSVLSLIADYERMREALEWFANPETYKPHPNGIAFDRRDLSYRARAALKEKPHD